MWRRARPRWKLKAMVCATIFAAVTSALAKDGETRSCETKFGGQVVCGDLVIGITLEQYEAGLNKRAEAIRAEEAEKRTQLQKLMELHERATSAEKDSLRNQIAAVEAEKRALEAEGKGVSDRLTNLQASYDGLVQNIPKWAAVYATLQPLSPSISQKSIEQVTEMLKRGDVLGAQRKLVEIANTVANLADLLQDQSKYADAEQLFRLVVEMDQVAFGKDHPNAAVDYDNLARLLQKQGKYAEAEPLLRWATEIFQASFGPEDPKTLALKSNYESLGRLIGQKSGSSAR
jgi:tetratricopeptide (TPR) repeat protein